MEATAYIAPLAPRPQTLKSKVTNGRRVFAIGGDGRGAWTRRWRDLVELHIADLGGSDKQTVVVALPSNNRELQ
jgi:hypothetical protein